MIRINLALKKGPVAVVSTGSGGGSFAGLRSYFKGKSGVPSSSAAIQELGRDVVIKMGIAVGVYFASDYALTQKKTEELGVVRAEADSLTAESTRLDSEIAKRAQYEAEKKRIDDFEKILTAKLETIDRLMVDRDSASRMLRELPDILPKELWLSSFSVEGSKASFKGRALNIDTVNEFLAKVNLSTHYRDGQSSMSEKKDELTGRLIQDFEIKASRRASNEF